MRLLEEMKVRRLFCDGGMGSMLQARGLQAGEMPEMWNLTHPEIVRDIHRQYLKAGADIMETNPDNSPVSIDLQTVFHLD
mgnify:FL=1